MYKKTIQSLMLIELVLSIAMLIVTTLKIALRITQKGHEKIGLKSDDSAGLDELWQS